MSESPIPASQAAFTVAPFGGQEAWYQELVDSDLAVDLGLPADGPAPDMRRLDIEPIIADRPDLMAIVLPGPDGGSQWLVMGPEAVVAVVTVPEESLADPGSVLQTWAESFTDAGAAGLIAAAYDELDGDDDADDSGPHFVGRLPLSGLSTHRPRNLTDEEWCGDLAEAAVDAAWEENELELEVDINLDLDPKDKALLFHIATYDSDPDIVETQVRQALLTAFRGFTPQRRVQERLVLALEADMEARLS